MRRQHAFILMFLSLLPAIKESSLLSCNAFLPLLMQVLFAFEEAIGFMLGPYKDKDGISAAACFCEMAAHTYEEGGTLQGLLQQLYER